MTADYRNPVITSLAVKDALDLGLGSTEEECRVYLKQACEMSAPVTHEDGDFRFEDVVLDIVDGVLEGVYPV